MLLPVRSFSGIEPVRGTLLLRVASSAIVAAALILTMLALHDPAPMPAPGVVRAARSDTEALWLQTCTPMGDHALDKTECRSAWSGHRKRFLKDRAPEEGSCIVACPAPSSAEGQ